MRYTKLLCLLMLLVIAIPSVAKKKGDQKKYGVFLVGASASFSDSLVYITDIQFLDSASVSDKGLLEGRVQYSMQLKDYLEGKKGMKDRTCFMFFSEKKNKLEKQLKKLRAKYEKGGTLTLKTVDSDFKFTKPEME